MTALPKTYPKYKNPNVEWVNTIPFDWDMCRFKFLFRPINRPISTNDEIITAFRDGTVTLRKNRREDGFTIALKEIGYQGVRRGDLVIHGMDGFAGAIGVSDSDGKTTPVNSVCIPITKGSVSEYYGYLLRALAISGYVSILARGIRERSTEFKWNIIGNLNLVVPEFEVQERIAIFLDEQTKAIDELIAKKERLIELLREKRQSLITHVVTKGLDPKARMKPSGVDWLGNIPEEWVIRKLKFIASVQASNIDKKSYEGEKSVLLCNYVDVYNNEFITSALPFMNATATEEQAKRLGLRVGDVVITKDSETPDDIGIPAFVREDIADLVCGYHLYLLRSYDKEILGQYLLRFLQSQATKGYFEIHSNGITRFGLGSYAIANTSVSIPPLAIQKQIAAFLDKETSRIDNAIELIESQLDQLREYRSSLIYAAVTGKIKV